jgi:HK97 gp10 family phage protein
MTAVSIKTHGFKELAAALEKLAPAVRDKVMTKAQQRGANMLADAARALVPVGKSKTYSRWSPGVDRSKAKPYFYAHNPGALRASISIVKIDDDINALKTIVVSHPNKKMGAKRVGGWYAHLVEFGHPIVQVVGPTRVRIVQGHYAPHPFMAPALEHNRDRYLDIYRAELSTGVERELGRLNRGKR